MVEDRSSCKVSTNHTQAVPFFRKGAKGSLKDSGAKGSLKDGPGDAGSLLTQGACREHRFLGGKRVSKEAPFSLSRNY